MLTLGNENPFKEEISVAEKTLSTSTDDSMIRGKLTNELVEMKLKAQLWEAKQPYYRGSDLEELSPMDYRTLRRGQKVVI